MDSEQKEVIAEESGKTLILTINNPERNNVMTRGIRNSIWQILRENEENNLKTVILRGAGKNFSAGADIKNLLSLEGDLADEYTTFVREFLIYVQNYPKITIGVVNGFAVGGGLELLLCLDLVYAGKTAKFGQTELNVGIIPGGGGTQRLPFAAGIRKAKEMIYTGNLIDSSDALMYGIINGVYDDSSVYNEALKIAEKINEKNFLSLVLAKRSINSTLKDMSVHLEAESEFYKLILNSSDGKEGLRAFLEKRKPNYNDAH